MRWDIGLLWALSTGFMMMIMMVIRKLRITTLPMYFLDCHNGATWAMAFNGIQHTWRPCYGNRISMQFFSAIEAGCNRSWNRKEDTTVSIQLILHPASIALRNSIELRVNTAEAGYLMKIIITQFNRRWHHCMCPCIQLPLTSLMILFIKNI